MRNKLHSKMFLPTIITTLHNNLSEKQENKNCHYCQRHYNAHHRIYRHKEGHNSLCSNRHKIKHLNHQELQMTYSKKADTSKLSTYPTATDSPNDAKHTEASINHIHKG